LGQLFLSFSHGFSFELELVGVVHEAVEDGIGETIRNGRREIEHGVEVTGRVRRAGAGRPGIEKTQPGI